MMSTSRIEPQDTPVPAHERAGLPQNLRRVLLLLTGHVGSNIFCTPAIHLLKLERPEVQFDVVATSGRGKSVFEGNPDVGQAFCRMTAGRIRALAGRYDLVIGLHRRQESI